jgi:diaminopimelate epimerase
VSCHVERLETGFACLLTVPAPTAVEAYSFPGGAHHSALVHYPDAAHLVVECPRPDQALRQHAEEVAVHLGATHQVSVVAVLLYDRDQQALTPLVRVPALGSMVWERSCGSGTASIGAYLASRERTSVRATVRQPGGTMQVRADHGAHGVRDLHIGGRVRIIAEGRAYIHG